MCETFDEVRDAMDQATTESYVKLFGKPGKELVAQLKDLFVKNDHGNSMHKKKIASMLNQGMSLKKSSTDCEKRVRDDPRHSGGKSGVLLLANSFKFGLQKLQQSQQWVGDDSGELDSGSDYIKAENVCAIIVCAKLPGSVSKMVVILICKFLRFGSLHSRAQL